MIKSAFGWLALMFALLIALPANAQGLPLERSDQRSWASIASLLRGVEPAYSITQAQVAERSIDKSRLSRQLDWSGQGGILIHVRMQSPTMSQGNVLPFGPPVPLATGKDPLEAIVAALVRPPVDTQQPNPGMAFDRSRSFYVWAFIKKGLFGGVRFARLSPEESSDLELSATRIISRPGWRDRVIIDRNLAIMQAIIEKLWKSAAARDQAAPLNVAFLAYRESGAALATVEEQVYNWGDRKTEDQRSIALVTRYKNILTVGGLRRQAIPALYPAPRKDVSKAGTIDEITKLLSNDIAQMDQLIGRSDLPNLKARESADYTSFTNLAVANAGAAAPTVKALLPRRF